MFECPVEDWKLGHDAADGGTTASVAALVDGRTLVYATVGDSCGVLAVPPSEGKRVSEGGGSMGVTVDELVAEHSPTNLREFTSRLCHTGVHVVYDHPDMFDDQPNNLVPVFARTAPHGTWELSDANLKRAEELGCGIKTERGDRACVLMTPESGRFSQMMLGVTRSLGDFYHQTFGVTFEPEVVLRDVAQVCAEAPGALLVVASDGVWDHWSFESAMEALVSPAASTGGAPLTDRPRVMDFFEETRCRGEEAFGDHADNLTGVVLAIPNPGPLAATATATRPATRSPIWMGA